MPRTKRDREREKAALRAELAEAIRRAEQRYPDDAAGNAWSLLVEQHLGNDEPDLVRRLAHLGPLYVEVKAVLASAKPLRGV